MAEKGQDARSVAETRPGLNQLLPIWLVSNWPRMYPYVTPEVLGCMDWMEVRR